MHSELRAQLAFRMTGLRLPGGPEPLDRHDLRPALAARYRDLTRLRYDFPIVLVDGGKGGTPVRTLTGVIDEVLASPALQGAEAERARKLVLRLEREVRVLLSEGTSGMLGRLWDAAAARLLSSGDDARATLLAQARKALKVDGEVVDCGARMPPRLLVHLWNGLQERNAARLKDEAVRLAFGLSEILAADAVRSRAGRSPKNLAHAVGTTHRDAFDFDTMSHLIGLAMPDRPLPEDRRERIAGLLHTLESHHPYADETGHSFVFDRCSPVLQAHEARRPRMLALARALAMARLEVAGEYVAERHDAVFESYGAASISESDRALFPGYLVCLNANDLDVREQGDLLTLLAARVPAKVLLQTDDVLGEDGDAAGFAARNRALTGMAVGLGDVFVVQSSASHLPRMHDGLLDALAYPGPALFSVFSGATRTSVLPPYLTAAAAMESRLFPAFTCDPQADTTERSRFSIEGNPQPDLDWPVHRLEYEDREHQRCTEEAAFTAVDFAACDSRYSRHFARVPREGNREGHEPVAGWIEHGGAAYTDAVPVIRMVDDEDVLESLVVAEPLILEAERCRRNWRALRQSAAFGSAVAAPAPAQAEPAPVAEAKAAPAAAPAAAAPAPAAAAPEAPASDDPYIETPRCTTCEECVQINNKMFLYDGNKQAYIADLAAGTYRQLVEAAESCQVSIIHPGKPRNPDEPGLEELLERAQPFL